MNGRFCIIEKTLPSIYGNSHLEIIKNRFCYLISGNYAERLERRHKKTVYRWLDNNHLGNDKLIKEYWEKPDQLIIQLPHKNILLREAINKKLIIKKGKKIEIPLNHPSFRKGIARSVFLSFFISILKSFLDHCIPSSDWANLIFSAMFLGIIKGITKLIFDVCYIHFSKSEKKITNRYALEKISPEILGETITTFLMICTGSKWFPPFGSGTKFSIKYFFKQIITTIIAGSLRELTLGIAQASFRGFIRYQLIMSFKPYTPSNNLLLSTAILTSSSIFSACFINLFFEQPFATE